MWTLNRPNLDVVQLHIRSRHVNQHLSRSDPDQGFSSFYIVGESPLRHTEEPAPARTKKPTAHQKLERLAKAFRIGDESRDFLLVNSFLIDLLLQSAEQIKLAFGKAENLELRVLNHGASKQLFAVIPTKLKPEAAMKKLRAFDENWWFSAPNEIRDYLEFTLEFV